MLDPDYPLIKPAGRSESLQSHLPSNKKESLDLILESKMMKRIVMNPPPSFIQYAASIQPPTPQANGPMMINSNGQAVLLGPTTNQNQNQNIDTGRTDIGNGNIIEPPTEDTPKTSDQDNKVKEGQVVLKGDKVVLVAPTETNTPVMSIPTATPTPTEVISSVIASTTVSATITSSAVTQPAITSTSTSVTSSAVSTTSAPASSTISSTSSTSSSESASSTSTTPSASSTPSSGSSSAHHPPSAGIIFLIILLSLAIFIALASLFRYLVKSRRMGCLPCFGKSRDDDDDDGLSDLVRGFDTPRTLGGGGYNPYFNVTSNYSHPSEMEQLSNLHSHEDEKNELERRSSLFAHQSHQNNRNQNNNNNSPFLHSQTNTPDPSDLKYGFNLPDLPIPPAALINQQRSRELEEIESGSSLPHHLLGETGPLEVRNALPGEVDNQDHNENAYNHDHTARGIQGLVGLGLGEGSPRFLGVDGHGLPVPWSTPLPPRPSSIDSFDNHQTNPNPFGSSSTLTTMAHAPPLGFPSPSLSHDSLSLPQRSATWASNLRNTLYNAISAARAPTLATLGNANTNGNSIDEDKFTRTIAVGNVYRNSSNRRKGIPVFDLEKGEGNGLKIVEEKDDPFNEIPPVNEKASSGLDRISSDSSDGSASTLTVPRRIGLGPGGAAERFKGYYARSKSSTNVSEISEVEDIRPPTRMAGGARAAGARTGSFVIV